METILILPQRRVSLFLQATGFVFFGFLFWLCWQFYLERMLSFDGAFYVFRLMESGKLSSSPGRYGDYLPEVFALFAFKMNWSLPAILRTYSVIFILLHYIIFLIITLWLKNNGAGIAILLVSCLAYYSAFYLPTMELHESMMLGILFWALIHPEMPYRSSAMKNIAMACALLTIFCMSYLHPLGIFLIVFAAGIELTGAGRLRDKGLWVVIIAGLGWVLLKFYVLSKQQYDQQQLIPFREMISHISEWKTWPSTHYVSGLADLHFRSLKWLALICLLFSLRKGILLFLFLLLFTVGFTFIFLANFQHGASPFAYDSYFILYGFIVGLSIVFLFYHPGRKNLVLLLVIPLLWVSVKKIYHVHALFSNRIAYLERIVHEAHLQGGKKYIIDSKCYPVDYAMTSWNVAFETLLYSSLPGPDSSVTIFIKRPEFSKLCDSVQNKHNVLLGVYFSPLWFTSNDMPAKYFSLPSTGYAYLTHSQDDTSFHEDIYSAKNIKIIPVLESIHLNSNDWTSVIPIEIINSSGHAIPAIPRSKNPVLAGFKLVDENGNTIIAEEKSALETDVITTAGCGITMYVPRLKGTYYAEPDLITEGVRHWHIPSQRIKITID